jgi:hypothetical protein
LSAEPGISQFAFSQEVTVQLPKIFQLLCPKRRDDLEGRVDESTKRVAQDKSTKRVAEAMLLSLLFGIVITAFGAWPKSAQALLWALACSGVGWVLGFLFGIPRSLASDALPQKLSGAAQPGAAQPGAAQPGAAQPGAHGVTTEVNTNLEQISDWLTKIIVGVTLVEIHPAIAQLEQAALLIAKSLGGPQDLSFGYAIMVYFSSSGFLGSYLLTRLYLQPALGKVGQPI